MTWRPSSPRRGAPCAPSRAGREETVTMRAVLFLPVILAASVPAAGEAPAGATAPAATQPAGLAARYPGDRGIGSDPAVLLHDDFEAPQIDRAAWPEVSDKLGALKLVRLAGNEGHQALQITATLEKNTGGHLFRRFGEGVERMHARFRVRFAEDIDYIHHFVTLCAELPAYRWPTGGAGERPAGDRKFTVGIEPWGRWGKYPPPGGWHFYCYWWQMPRSRDGKYWGAGFDEDAYAVPTRGTWYCVEVMVACNTPGKPDGQVALWIDGRRLAHHANVNWRSSEKLLLNGFWLMLYVTEYSAKRNRVNTVWFDDVVVAREYIGPPVRPAAETRPSGAGAPR